MRKSINSLIKNALIVLALGIFLICIIPHRSNTVAHMVLFPLEKKIQSKIEFASSRTWLPGNISLYDLSIIDENGRLYYSKTANINYNLFDILFKNKVISFDLEKVKFYRGIDLLNSVTNMLIISKIPDVEFKKIVLTVGLREDGIDIKNIYAYNNLLRIKGSGWIEKDGSLDCNVNFSFHKDITDKVPHPQALTKLA